MPLSAVFRDSWEAVDVTEAVRELLMDSRPSRHVLTVRFESPGGKSIAASHFLRGVPDKEHAFLMLFSEDSDEGEVAEDGGAPPSRPLVHSHALVQRFGKLPLLDEQEDNGPQIIPVFKKRIRILTTKDPSTSEEPTSVVTSIRRAYDDFVESYNLTADGRTVRNTRSVIDNQLHDADSEPEEYSSNKYTSLLDSEPSKRIDFPPIKESRLNKGKRAKRKKGKKQKQSPMNSLWDNSISVS